MLISERLEMQFCCLHVSQSGFKRPLLYDAIGLQVHVYEVPRYVAATGETKMAFRVFDILHLVVCIRYCSGTRRYMCLFLFAPRSLYLVVLLYHFSLDFGCSFASSADLIAARTSGSFSRKRTWNVVESLVPLYLILSWILAG